MKVDYLRVIERPLYLLRYSGLFRLDLEHLSVDQLAIFHCEHEQSWLTPDACVVGEPIATVVTRWTLQASEVPQHRCLSE